MLERCRRWLPGLGSAMGGTTDRAWPLYGAAFLMALNLSMAWTAMPFILTAIGGTKAHVGYAPALNTFAYMIALFVTGSLLGHLKVRPTTLRAATAAFLATAAMACTVLAARLLPGRPLVWIWTIILCGGVGGAAMALYWPFLMSWVSADYEGVRLNRRFGRYNGAWSSGAMAGPVIGAWLVEISPALPILAAAMFIGLALLALSFARDAAASPSGGVAAVLPVIGGRGSFAARYASDTGAGKGLTAGVTEVTCSPRMLAACRWMSRIALFNACLCFAMIRSQFALVFTGLGFPESQFGVYQTIYALCTFGVLVTAGRWAVWHFKPALLTAAQLLLLTTLLMVIYGRTLPVFFTSSVLLGIAYGFAYSSHLYYGASTSRRRSARMAIHEIVIALGLTVGAAAGGYLCEHVGLYTPYWFAVALVGFGAVVQTAIQAVAPTLPGIEPAE